MLGIAWLTIQTSSLDDFRAFYCAGTVLRHGQNPYLSEPLRRCEQDTAINRSDAVLQKTAIPAPLPLYVIGLFSALSLLPFGAAAFVLTFAMLCAVASAIVMLTRLTGLGPLVVVSALLLSTLGTAITLGQLTPFVIAAVCAAALSLRFGRFTAAAFFGSVTMLEPTIGLPVCLSLAIWIPRTRIALLIMWLALAAGALSFGVGTNVQYFLNVLPAHALSEFASDEQYSTTVVAHALGLSAGAAIIFGTVWYVVMLGAGTALARIAAIRLKDPAFYALLPPALCVIGGSFVHITQIAVAIPVTLLLLTRTGSRRVASVALVLLALPWPMSQAPIFSLVAFVIVFAMLYTIYEGNVVLAAGCALAAAAIALGLNHAYSIEHHAAAHVATSAQIDSRLAEASWAKLMLGSYSYGDALSWLKRAPTWIGLSLLIWSLCLALFGKRAT